MDIGLRIRVPIIAGLDIGEHIRKCASRPAGMDVAEWDGVGMAAQFWDRGEVVVVRICVCRSWTVGWIHDHLEFEVGVGC